MMVCVFGQGTSFKVSEYDQHPDYYLGLLLKPLKM